MKDASDVSSHAAKPLSLGLTHGKCKISIFVACTIWIVAACSSLIASVVAPRSKSDQLPERGDLSTEQS